MAGRQSLSRRITDALDRQAKGPRGNGHWSRVEILAVPLRFRVIVRTPLFRKVGLGKRVHMVFRWLRAELPEDVVHRVVAVHTLAPGEEKRRLPSG